MREMTVFGGVERRRRWSVEERARIVSEAFSPGARVGDAANRHEISRGLICNWRRELSALKGGSGFVEALVSEAAAERESPALALEIELSGGRQVRVYASASAGLVSAELKALL